MDAATAAVQIDLLDKAIASGVLTVRHGDTMTTYRSLDEMIRVRDGLSRQTGAVGGTTRTRTRYIYQLRRGY